MVLVLALGAGCASSVDDDQTVGVGPAGGRIGSASGPAQVDVPPGLATRPGSIRITATQPGPGIGPGALADAAVALGPAVRIDPDVELGGASVRLPVDIGALPTANGRTATPANVFVAEFNEVFQAWVPLASTFDPATGQVVAKAPHFSWFQEYVVDPASREWTALKSGLDAVMDSAAYRVFVNPDKKEIDCPPDDGRWDVRVPEPEVEACVATGPDGRPELRVENGLRYGAYLQLPRGADTAPVNGTKLVSLIVGAFHGPLDQQYVEGRGIVAFPLPRGAETRGLSFPFEIDGVALTLSTVLAVLGWIPSARTYEEVLGRVVSSGVLVRLTDDRVTITSFVRELTVAVKRESPAVPGYAESAQVINDVMNCAAAQVERSGGDLERVLSVVKGCAGYALTAIRDQLRRNVGDVLSVVNSFPDTVEALGGLIDLGRTGGGLREPFAISVRPRVRDDLRAVDWSSVVRDPECDVVDGEPRIETRGTTFADLTGDNAVDAIVVATCPSPTSSNPENLYLFDGTSPPSSPRLLARFPGDRNLYLRNSQVTVAGRTATVRADNVSPSGSLCCPDQRYQQSFTWSSATLRPGQRTLMPL
ncbi:hypothetical protein [Actinomycetospora termitidis]|uniref:Lipoprotein n=1 Tax=Actinomycetospora termitidis TaxID=3053470 RepID=A0ABT7MEB1_9PSEU|nr:hypothetical protein [Actinomycetospora sp. Odt1-22]MDL5158995.1 hypothetical protein [Actinomycetospora sp. Odt1-22]